MMSAMGGGRGAGDLSGMSETTARVESVAIFRVVQDFTFMYLFIKPILYDTALPQLKLEGGKRQV